MTVHEVSGAAGLLAALAIAVAGDAIHVDTANALNGFAHPLRPELGFAYAGGPTIEGFDFDDGSGQYVTIRSKHRDDPSKWARFHGRTQIRDCAYIRIEYIGFAHWHEQNTNPVPIENSHHIVIDHNDILDGGTGLRVGPNVQFIGITNNRFGGHRSDSMTIFGLSNFLIQGNRDVDYARRTEPPGPNSPHLDFIQAVGSCSDGLIEGNAFLFQGAVDSDTGAALGKVCQGVFLDDAPYQRIVVENNLIHTNAVNGLLVQSASDCLARRNTVLNWGPNTDTNIQFRDPVGSNVSEFNVGNAGAGSGGLTLASGQYDAAYQSVAPGGPATIEDFRPVREGPADFGSGVGAEKLIADLLQGEAQMDFNTIIAATIDDPTMGTVEIVGTPGVGSTDHKVRWNKDPVWLALNGPGTGTYTIRDQAGNESTTTWQQDLTNTPNLAVADVFAAVDDSAALIDMAVLGNDTA